MPLKKWLLFLNFFQSQGMNPVSIELINNIVKGKGILSGPSDLMG